MKLSNFHDGSVSEALTSGQIESLHVQLCFLNDM